MSAYAKLAGEIGKLLSVFAPSDIVIGWRACLGGSYVLVVKRSIWWACRGDRGEDVTGFHGRCTCEEVWEKG